MSDLIDRQAAIDEINEYGSGDTIYMSVAELKRRIEHLPPEQPDIVRCKDCKYSRIVDGDMMCKNPKAWVVATYSNFGCILAERRTDG